jgi:lysozyme family protein
MFKTFNDYWTNEYIPTTGFVEDVPQLFGLTSTFDPALELLDEDEGGYVNNPADKGGPTNRGITLVTFRRWIKDTATISDLKAITDEQIRLIYKRVFWDGVHADELPSGVDYCVFDFAVNSGPARAIKYLQIALQPTYKGQIDGLIGPETLRAVRLVSAATIIENITTLRQQFVRGLSNYPTFKNGWEKRISSVRNDALNMVGNSSSTTTSIVKENWLAKFIAAIMQLLGVK